MHFPCVFRKSHSMRWLQFILMACISAYSYSETHTDFNPCSVEIPAGSDWIKGSPEPLFYCIYIENEVLERDNNPSSQYAILHSRVIDLLLRKQLELKQKSVEIS